MGEYNVQPVLQLERNDLFFDQRSDYLCLVPINDVVPDLETFVMISMEPKTQLVLSLQLDVLPGNALARLHGRPPATGAFDLHRQVESERLSAFREPTDGLYSRPQITRLERVLCSEPRYDVRGRNHHRRVQHTHKFL